MSVCCRDAKKVRAKTNREPKKDPGAQVLKMVNRGPSNVLKPMESQNKRVGQLMASQRSSIRVRKTRLQKQIGNWHTEQSASGALCYAHQNVTIY